MRIRCKNEAIIERNIPSTARMSPASSPLCTYASDSAFLLVPKPVDYERPWLTIHRRFLNGEGGVEPKGDFELR